MAFPALETASPAATVAAPQVPGTADQSFGARRRARAVDNGRLGMAIFLAAETMVFAALASAFLILRAGSGAWPPPGQPRLPVGVTALNTLVLLASAWTMRRALAAGRSAGVQRGAAGGEARAAGRWLGLTAALGAAFLAVQGVEWVRLVGFGLRASASLYGATFYTLIGAHGVHVAAAVAVVAVLLWQTVRAAPSAAGRAGLEAGAMYWYFVVAVWPMLYVLVYLS